MSRVTSQVILCPVCGGRVQVTHRDKVNRCEYCGSPVLGSEQGRNCKNHPKTLAKGVCHVCGSLVCEECMEKRVGDYGGKLLTIVNCNDPACVSSSSWAKPLNVEYMRLTNMEWADKIDNAILRVSGLGGLLLMIFELGLILLMVYVQYFTQWGLAGTNIPFYFIRGDIMIVMGILGNLLSAIVMQTSLQTYIHERQLKSGVMLLFLIMMEIVYLLVRGLVFNLRNFPSVYLLPTLIAAFGVAVLLVLFSAVAAIVVGYKKRRQIKRAMLTLGLTMGS
ncbi:MAG: B-box zinc finger protein [Candidatus Thorarchaeota archaeon]